MQGRTTISSNLWLALATAFALSMTAELRAATIQVPAQFPTIQLAISAAVNGDLVLVAPGTYRSTIDLLGKSITVKSTGGPRVTIISAAGLNGTVISARNGETTSTLVEGFTLTGGTGTLIGGRHRGGGIVCEIASPSIRNCIITGNIADDGGAIYCFFGSPRILNCVMVNNAAQNGGGAYDDIANPLIMNCTVTANNATLGGGFFGTSGSTPRLINCIVWNNIGGSFQGAGAKIVTFSDVQGGVIGVGNLDANPQFARSTEGLFHLLSSSPCIDAGDSSLPQSGQTDIDGEPRLIGRHIDMGADEFRCAADVNYDQIVNVDDLLEVINAWGACTSPCAADVAPAYSPDGSVDVDDLLAVILNWGGCH